MYDGQTTNSSVRNASLPVKIDCPGSAMPATCEQEDRADPAEERNRSEHVREERQVPRVGTDERDHPPAPGFQIISTRTAKPSTAAP